ncbi:MAG: sigma-70 family RNA polymerase sigma factor, partial [Chitinophagaceae bacterium]|nr:sigma-70 family RNA polymerase sigma factor [Chitinophagaceae bacterium]
MPTATLNNEQELLLRISEGDAVAFGKLYQHYYVQLQPVFMNYTRNASETEEILQETFIKVWLNRDKLSEVTHFRGWLFKVATRVYLKAVRKRLVYEQKLEEMGSAKAQQYDMVTPLETTHVQEIKKLVNEAVQLLPEQRRRIYELSRKEGLRIEEIAQQLGITTRTVKN